MSEFATKSCLLCGLTISANPMKNHPTAFLAGKCNRCWAKLTTERSAWSVTSEIENIDLLEDLKQLRCSLCSTRLSTNPTKCAPVAYLNQKCTTCWSRLTTETREVTAGTKSQQVAITAIDTTDPAWQQASSARRSRI